MTEPVIRIRRARLGAPAPAVSRWDCYCHSCGHYKRCACSVRAVCNSCGIGAKILQARWVSGSPCAVCEFGSLVLL